MQREAVNDAWDLPKEDILKPFAARFPQYQVEEDLDPFDWRWYYAFQAMGDVATSDVSKGYRDAIRERDAIASMTALASPGLAIQRHLQHLARTDVSAQLAYDAAIRRYHSALQDFYFPMIFGQLDFDRKKLADYPQFKQLGL